MNMHKYDHTKGSKAFSYFSVVAKNYLILHNNNNYKKYKLHVDASVLNEKEVNSSSSYMIDFTEAIVDYFEERLPFIFKKKKDLDISYAILELIKKRNDIENFNKKSLYILIREMTDVETSQITKVVNILKKHYNKVASDFSKYGYIRTDKNKFF